MFNLTFLNVNRDFLTGFHKRKLQRKKKAQEELKQQLQDERKRLKAEAKESYKKLVVSHRPIPELEHLLKDEYEDEDVNVTVVELSTNEIASSNNCIGPNQVKYESDEEAEVKEEIDEEYIPGMELKQRVTTKEIKQEKKNFGSQKDVKKALKKQATKNVQKSKVFQLKNKIEQQKQRKKSLQQKKERLKFRSKKMKGKKHAQLR